VTARIGRALPGDSFGEPTKGKGLLYSKTGIWAIRLSFLAGMILLFEWYVTAFDVSRALLAPPSAIAESVVELVFQTPFPVIRALGDSLLALGIGLTLVLILGIPIGLAMGRSRRFESLLDPWVTVLYVMPSIAFIPILVITVGFDFTLRVILVVISGIFPMIINTMAGVKAVDPEYVDGGRAFTASELQIMRTIIVPASLPFIFAGLRIAFSSAWVGVILAEMTAVLTGIGGLILTYSNFFRTADLFVPILAIMIVAVFIQWSMAKLMVRLTPWHQDLREPEA
jgi:NitT/TauT family transport system permease protein